MSEPVVLPERRFDLLAWTAHCAHIIDAELDRRNITVRHLHSEGIIRTRHNFRKRLRSADLRASELADLCTYLKIDILQISTTYLAVDRNEAYNSATYINITEILAAMAALADSTKVDEPLSAEQLRPAVVDFIALKIFDQLREHNERVHIARNIPQAVSQMPVRMSA